MSWSCGQTFGRNGQPKQPQGQWPNQQNTNMRSPTKPRTEVGWGKDGYARCTPLRGRQNLRQHVPVLPRDAVIQLGLLEETSTAHL